MPPAAKHTHILRSAQRALQILGVVYRSGEGKQLTEVSAETGIDKATALRMLATLMAEGIIRRDPVSGRYGPDMRSWIYLAPTVQAGLALVSEVQKALVHLCETCGATAEIFLPTPDGNNTAEVMWSSARTALHYQPAKAPAIVPLHASAAGRCVLAGRTQEEIQDYLKGPLARITDRTITSHVKLKKILAQIHQLGYDIHLGEVTPGVSSIAVPIHSADGKAVGAIALALPGEHEPEVFEKYLPALIEGQKKISPLFKYETWAELVRSNRLPTTSNPSPWDLTDSGVGQSSTSLVRTVSRMMRLMAIVFKHPEGISIRELARQRQLDKTTTWRLLNTLCAADVIWQDGPDEYYRISPRFWLRHANILRVATSLTRMVAGVLEELARKIGATALLALPDKEMRNSVIYQFALPHTPLCFHPEYGPLGPLHVTATGKTYLAAQTKSEVERYIQAGLTALTDRSITSPKELLAELERVQTAGYAFSREELIDGVTACAVPIYDSAGSIAGSVGVVPLTSALARADVDQWVGWLKEAARSLSPLLVGDWRAQLEEIQKRNN